MSFALYASRIPNFRLCFYCVLMSQTIVSILSVDDDGLMYASQFVEEVYFEQDTTDHKGSKVIRKARKPTAEDEKLTLPDMYGEALFVCPDGYQLDGNKCFSRVVSMPLESCPYGAYRNKVGSCIAVDSVPPEKACPAGFEWYLKGCIRREVMDAQPRCPYQFYLHDGFCISKQDLSPLNSCPPGFNPHAGDCIRVQKAAAEKSCPKGFEKVITPSSSVSCSKALELPVIENCIPGFELSPSSSGPAICVQTLRFTGKPRCEPGYSMTADHACMRESISTAVPQCPSGTYFHFDKCIQQMKEEPIRTCSAGRLYDPDSQLCVLQDDKKGIRTSKYGGETLASEKPLVVCPENFTWAESSSGKYQSRSTCVRTVTHPASFKCEKGILDGSSCVEKSMVEPKFVYDNPWCNNNFAAVVRDSPKDLPVCLQKVEQTPKYVCEKGFRLDKKPDGTVCRKTETADPVYTCPLGSILEGSLCASSEVLPGLVHCPTGEAPNSSGRCPALLTTPLEISCPTGYKVGTYDSSSPKHNNPGVCERVEYADVQEVCPLGYNRDKQHTRDDKKACVAEKMVPSTSICEPGFLSQGKECVKIVEVSPSLVGPNGNMSACRPSRDGDPACEMEMRYYSKITPKGEKKGLQNQKKFGSV